MGATLIINPGSSSKKFALFKANELLMSWLFEREEQRYTVCTEQNKTKSLCREISTEDFASALRFVIEEAIVAELIARQDDIGAVGIRIVAPASYFTAHRLIDNEFVEKLRDLHVMAPHHIPHMVTEIEVVRTELPNAKFVGISDSAFHHPGDAIAKMVSMPKADVDRFDIRRFGYHGISVASVVKRLEAKDKVVPYRLIVCHIGSGVSVTAVHDGKSVATTMGYTPVSGLMMSSRMGDVPADMLAALIIRKGLSGEAIFNYLYNEGGFRGLAGVRDLRLVLDRASKGDMDAKDALSLWGRQVRGAIGSLAMQMGGVDTIVLTGTAAERNPAVRTLLVGEMQLLRTYIHEERNEALINSEGYIQTDDSETKIVVIKTDELGEMNRIVSKC